MKNYQPKFSIIMPTYNRCYVIWKAINSVLAQSYPFFELIVVDDGSNDTTDKLIREFSDPRIRYFKLSKNNGASIARNYGLKKAKGEYVAYLDSDNTWYSEFLEVMEAAFARNDDKILVFCKKNYRLTLIENRVESRLRDETTNTNKHFDLKRLWQRRILIDTNTMCHRRLEILELGGWDEELNFWEDWELTLRISTKYPKGFLSLNRTMMDYEQKINIDNQQNTFASWERAEKQIFEKYEGNPLLTDQTWFPPSKGNRSTLGIVEYLRDKKK